MNYYDFKYILNAYSERKSRDDCDLGKIREKFAEIVDAVGVKSKLLKHYKDCTGTIVKFGQGKPQFCFPETVCDFCVELLLRYTSPDFKKIRSQKFASVNPETSSFLIDGFTRYLADLGHDESTVILERWKMDRRLHHHANISKSKLTCACGKLTDNAQKYELLLDYEDSVYFIHHMVTQVEQLQDTIESIFSEYESARYEEISDGAMLISKDMDHTAPQEDIVRSVLLADFLEQDKEYQSLIEKLNKLLAEPGFKQGLKGRYNKITSELSSIKKKYEMELGGESTPEGLVAPLNLEHPLKILHKAIMSIRENEQDRIDREEKEASLSEEEIQKRTEAINQLKEFYEKSGFCFDLPNIAENEDELFIESLKDEIIGTIAFPCCKTEKITVFKDSTGRSVIKCPRCGRLSIFYFDKMVAETVPDVRQKTQSRV